MKEASQKLRVAFLYDDSLDRPDGVSHQVKTLGKWLSAQGHDVIYLVGQTRMKQWAGGQIFSLSRNLKVTFNGNRVSTPLPASSRQIKKVIKQKKLDVVHVQVPYSPLMAQKVINRLSDNVAVVGTFHILPVNYTSAWGTHLLRFIYGRSLKRFAKITAVSPAAAGFAKESLGLNSTIIPNTLDIRAMSVPKPKNEKNHIVFLGRLVKRKGCEELLKAFALLKLKIPAAKLTIAGDGPERRKLEKVVKQNDLESAVKFRGFIDEADKPAFLASAAIACFPATGGESFGIVLVEAMAAGAGVVLAGNNPGYASVLGARSKTLIEPNQTADLATRLEIFLTDQYLAASVHAWQQEHVQRYDISVVGEQMLKMYKEAIASRRQNP